eukprot:GDKI01031888.1.p2 GENE.GDKI01031888.1~~GDKI01031888.1.p2  ORF type:complete len:223 (-),score=96.23 GDKI01031888.1:233-847(-)
MSAEEATQQTGEHEEEYVQEEEVVSGDWNVPQVDLKEVAVNTGEEEEDTFWKHRAKLYRWVGDSSEWKERGVGDAKLLKHKETGKIRFLLRQEKTLKVVANHYVVARDPYCKLTPNAGSEKIWVWSVPDFAEGELKVEQFALKFGQADQAKIFKEQFEAACVENTKVFGETATSPKAEAAKPQSPEKEKKEEAPAKEGEKKADA